MYTISPSIKYISSAPKVAGKTSGLIQRLFLPAFYALSFAGFGLLSFLPHALRLDSRDLTVPFRAFVLFLGMTLLLMGLSNKLFRFSMGLRLFMLFWSLYLVRLVCDTYYDPIFLVRQRELYLLYGIGISLIPSLAFFITPTSFCLRRSMLLLYALITLLSVLCLTEVRTASVFGENFRLAGNPTANPISVGHYGVSLSILSLVLYFTPEFRRSWIRTFALITFFLGLVVLLFTGSRGPTICLVIVMPLVFINLIHSRGNRIKIIILMTLSFILIPILFKSVAERGGSFSNRMSSLESIDEATDENRVNLWREALTEVYNNPIKGMAVEIPGVGYPHNIIIEGFLATGICGGLILMSIIAYGIYKSIYLIRNNANGYWIALLYVQYTIGAMFSGAIYDNNEFWYLYAGVMAISNKVST